MSFARVEPDCQEVSIELELDRSLPMVVADRIQIQQVVFNLLRNAWEAIGEQPDGPGEIHIATSMPDQRHLVVAIRDTGPGVAPENIDDLFEQFYSTKPDGLGMGLPISRSIMAAHGGCLSAKPEDSGLTFEIAIPAGDI